MTSERNDDLIGYENHNRGSSIKSIPAKIFGFAFAAYMYTMIVAIPWMNWNYARENGFVKWLLLGEVVATANGMNP